MRTTLLIILLFAGSQVQAQYKMKWCNSNGSRITSIDSDPQKGHVVKLDGTRLDGDLYIKIKEADTVLFKIKTPSGKVKLNRDEISEFGLDLTIADIEQGKEAIEQFQEGSITLNSGKELKGKVLVSKEPLFCDKLEARPFPGSENVPNSNPKSKVSKKHYSRYMYRSVFLADEAGKVRPYSSLELQSAQMNVDGEMFFWERYGQSLTKHLVHGKYSMMGNPFPTTKDLGKQQANQAVINDVQRARVESAAEKGKIAAPIQATASTVYNTEYLIHLPAEADFLVVTPENFKEFVDRFLTPCPQYHQIDKKAKKDLDSISDMKDIVEFLNTSCE